jgi:hypothetical protein
VRDRGIHTDSSVRDTATHPVQTLAKLVTAFVAVPAVVLLTGAGIASADTPGSGQLPFNVAGPVGIGAVVLGIFGVVIGLVRRRKLAKVTPVTPANRPLPMAAKAQQAVTSALTTPMERVVDERVA